MIPRLPFELVPWVLLVQLLGCGDRTHQVTSSATGADTGGGQTGNPVTADCHNAWCKIPAGTFTMGCTAEEYGCVESAELATPVTLTRDFVIQQFELTRGEWQAFAATDPTEGDTSGAATCTDPKCPVADLTWFEAAAYANWLSDHHDPPLPRCYELIDCTHEPGSHLACQRAHLTADSIYACTGFRMPSEPEWEYASRAGTTTAFYGGPIEPQEHDSDCVYQPSLEPNAWYCYNSGGVTHIGGQKAPNAYGLFDTEGSVYEWVQTKYVHGYAQFPAVDPDPEQEDYDDRAYKGGVWTAFATICRSSSALSAGWYTPGPGVRLARTLAPGETW